MIDILDDENNPAYGGPPYDKKPLSIYIHIPFCVKKCVYCDFLSFPVGGSCVSGYGAYREKYIEALCEELKSYAYLAETRIVRTIYIGGGTPSILDEDDITVIMTSVRHIFDIEDNAEISIEVNPGTLTGRKAAEYIANGINRMSIGLQSAQKDELAALGRIHNYDQFLAAYDMAREAGFRNINIDIMSDIPGQTMRSYLDTLEKVLRCGPEHISSYSLIVEEGTPLAANKELLSLIPDEDTDREMYNVTDKLLKAGGYHRYEISNYSKHGYECRHNVGYWIRRDYLGFGIGAASLIDNVRFQNGRDLAAYLAHPLDCREEEQSLTTQEQMEETLFLGLRLTKGVSYDAFARQYGSSLQEIYGEVIARNVADGLLQVTEGKENEKRGRYLALTKRGLDLSNYVMAQFLF